MGCQRVWWTRSAARRPVPPTEPWERRLRRRIENDGQVVALARKAVGRTTDAAEAARRIERFVHAYIDRKDLSVGYATALEIAAALVSEINTNSVVMDATDNFDGSFFIRSTLA